MAFGVVWFGFCAAAQLRLTEVEQPWSTEFTLLALGGGLAFVLAALLAAGTAPARGVIGVDVADIRVRRLVVAALVLLAAGVAGAAYKANRLDGIPLFSANPDEVRGRAIREDGVNLPSWSTALTNGFYLSMWCALAAIWALPRITPRRRVAALWLLAGLGLVGVGLEASRNLIVFAVAVPLIAAYLLIRPRGRARALAWTAAVVGVLVIGVGGLFVLRLERGDGVAKGYIDRESERQPALLRPVLPVYVNAVYPLEGARRLYDAVPERYPYDLGGTSLASLPNSAFPEGKPQVGEEVANLMRTARPERLTWTVSSYQGRLIADLGWRGVVLGSVLLGLLFGSLYRWARARHGFVAFAIVAYAAYYSAYMLYDNQLSFTLIALFDVVVIGTVNAYVRGWLDEPVRLLAGAARRTATS